MKNRFTEEQDTVTSSIWYLDKLKETGDQRYLRAAISVLSGIGHKLEMRYPESAPIRYIHGQFTASAALLQGLLINALADGDTAEALSMYSGYFRPAAEAMLSGFTSD
jgi:hypothetical protein